MLTWTDQSRKKHYASLKINEIAQHSYQILKYDLLLTTKYDQ